MSAQQPERRRARRVPASFPVRLTSRDKPLDGHMRDLSEIGLCCSYPEPIEEMTQVRLGLQLPGEEHIHEVEGAVVRCEAIAGKNPDHEIAVYFTSVPRASRDALRNWVAKHP